MPTILLTVDALRADHLSQYGYHRKTLPALDELNTLTFKNAFANGPNTARSIPSFLTSRYSFKKAIQEGPTVASVLNDAGITTAAFHSNTYLTTEIGTIPGFETYEDFMNEMDLSNEEQSLTRPTSYRLLNQFTDMIGPVIRKFPRVHDLSTTVFDAVTPSGVSHPYQVYMSAEQLTDHVIDWLDGECSGEFFLWVHYMDPHRPYGLHPTDPEFIDGDISQEEIRELTIKASTHWSELTNEEEELLVNLYDSDIHYLSRHLSRLIEFMKEEGIWDETNVLFSSDHGEEFGEHGHAFHRNRPYDELIHVPLTLKPANSATDGTQKTVHEQRELIDLAPTICRFHDVKEKRFNGRDLLKGKPRSVVSVGSLRDNDRCVAVRNDNWKYIVSRSEDGQVFEELYDLIDDPDELHSVVDGNRDVISERRSNIPQRILEHNNSDQSSDYSEEVQQRLDALGYVE